jgi:hypothetical protein
MMRLAQQRRILSAAFAAALCLATAPAFAACSTPLGNAGDVVYSSNSNTMAYCNGTFWIAMGLNSAVSYGALTTNDFCIATSGTAISCSTASTGTGNVVLSSSPTMTGTVAGANSTWTGQVAVGTTTLSGAMNVAGTITSTGETINGTATATTFSGSGASLTGIGIPSLSATGTANSTTFLRGDNTWATAGGASFRTSCPANFTLIADSGTAEAFCISTSSETSGTYANAGTACYNKSPHAHLCSEAEWIEACNSGQATGMGSAWEFIAGHTGLTGYYEGYLVMGGSGCGSTTGSTGSYPFRCCFR